MTGEESHESIQYTNLPKARVQSLGVSLQFDAWTFYLTDFNLKLW